MARQITPRNTKTTGKPARTAAKKTAKVASYGAGQAIGAKAAEAAGTTATQAKVASDILKVLGIML